MKICTKCQEEKSYEEFYKSKKIKNGYYPSCKKCHIDQMKLIRKNNPEETRKRDQQFYLKNKERSNKKSKEYYLNNREKRLNQQKQYYENNREHAKKVMRQYYRNNKETFQHKSKKWRDKNKNWSKNKRQSDINFKLRQQLRSRLYSALKKNFKTGSAVRDLGCSIQELKMYLESKFEKGMTWDNWSTNGWHIDHIIPLSHFDLTNREDLLKACHYTNLQPLWAEDNLSKKTSNMC